MTPNTQEDDDDYVPDRPGLILQWVWLWIPFAVIVGLYLYFFDPTKQQVLPPCALHEATGLHCLGCGATRATHYLVHGNFSSAARCNLYYLVALVLLSYASIVSLVNRFTAFRLPMIPFGWKMMITVVTTTILFTVLRNVPLFPFNLLAPV